MREKCWKFGIFYKNAERESGKRVLGSHPENKREVSVRLGKFGPMVQIGTVDDDEKPIFASLPPEFQIESISLEQALDLFSLPRELGEYNDEVVLSNNGKFVHQGNNKGKMCSMNR